MYLSLSCLELNHFFERAGNPSQHSGAPHHGEKVELTVHGLNDQLNFQLKGYFKRRARACFAIGSDMPLLTPLFCEMDLVPVVTKATCDIEVGLIREMNIARKNANALLGQNRHCQGVHVMDCFIGRLIQPIAPNVYFLNVETYFQNS